MGYQEPHSGDAYSYLMTRDLQGFQRTILTFPLKHDLQKDSLYVVSFFVSMADGIKVCDGFFEIAFSAEPVNTLNTRKACKELVTKLSVEDTSQFCNKESWIKVEFLYKAFGEEKYLYIGNMNSTKFKEEYDNKDVRYYLDDVLMIKK